MPAYYNYTAIYGTQTTVNGSAHDYNYAPGSSSTWQWTGSTTSFVMVEENAAGAIFNGDEDANEYVDFNDRLGEIWGQHVVIGGTDRQIIWDYTFEVTDGTSTWRVGVIDVDLNNDNDLQDSGEDGYYLVFPDGLPPVDTGLTYTGIVENDAGTAHTGLGGTVVCFARGTTIETADGPRAVETLRPGDMVLTLDRGYRPLRWSGRTTTQAEGKHRPVVFEAGAIGNDRRLTVSPQHCVHVAGAEVELLTGHVEALVRAVHLAGRPGIHRDPNFATIDYHHLLFDCHELVISHGIASESFYPGTQAMRALSPRNRRKVCKVLGDPAQYGEMVRPLLSRAEAACLGAAGLGYSAVPRRPARSVKYCHATRPERPPRVTDHSMASARRSASLMSMA